MPLKLVALDRDGTVIRWVHHLTRRDQMVLLPGAGEAIARLNGAGVAVALMTNQSVVGRGYISLQELDSLHSHLDGLLAQLGAHIDHYLVCPHAPEDGCACRKPAPGLLLTLMRQVGAADDETALIGDTESDMVTATNAGVLGLRVLSGVPFLEGRSGSEYYDLAAAVDALLAQPPASEASHD